MVVNHRHVVEHLRHLGVELEGLLVLLKALLCSPLLA